MHYDGLRCQHVPVPELHAHRRPHLPTCVQLSCYGLLCGPRFYRSCGQYLNSTLAHCLDILKNEPFFLSMHYDGMWGRHVLVPELHAHR
jgi:hypothetical protein